MVKKVLSKVMKTAAFLMMGIIIFVFLSQILCGKWLTANKETYTTQGLYALEDNSIDVFVLGTSHVVTGISPMVMYEEYGISAYTLGMGHAPMSASYCWLKECEKTQDLSTVVIDVSILYKPIKELYFRRAFDPMKLSWNKIKAVYEHSRQEGADSFASYVFPIITWHSRWKELSAEDFGLKKNDTFVYRGNVMKSKVDPEVDYNKLVIDHDENTELEMREEQLVYFEKIVSYCEEHDINLVLIKTPKESWTLAESRGVDALAKKYGLPFLDFNYENMIKEVGIDAATDLRDPEHMNLKGADKLSLYLGKYLKENYELKDYREENYHPVDMEQYHRDRDDVYLQLSQDVKEYLKRLNNDRYSIIIQLTDDISEYWTEDLQKILEKLGLKTDIGSLSGKNYVGILEQGTCIYEDSSEKPISYEGEWAEGCSYVLEGDINKGKSETRMLVNGHEEKFNVKGMNILVYDIEKRRIINEAAIYKQTKEEKLKIKQVYAFN